MPEDEAAVNFIGASMLCDGADETREQTGEKVRQQVMGI